MPQIPFPLPCDAVLPVFGDGGLFGLAQDIRRWLHAPADGAASFAAARGGDGAVVLMLIDGLGDAFLQRHGQGSAILKHRQRRLTSVLPSTTASAVTTLMSGLAPSAHGLTGWFINDRRFGGLIAPLPLYRRGAGRLSVRGLAERLFPYSSMFDNCRMPVAVVAPQDIAYSTFSHRHVRGARVHAYRGPDAFVPAILAALNAHERVPSYVHAYYPRFDAVCHRYGSNSEQAIAEFQRVDRYFSLLLDSSPGSTVVLTADHGFTDASERRHLRAARLPALPRMLASPLFGERRLAFCSVREGAVSDFESWARECLMGRAVAVRSAEMIKAGLMGPRPFHRRLAERCGSHALLMEPGWTISDRLPLERQHRMIGVHGGLSAEEMWVPLVVACV